MDRQELVDSILDGRAEIAHGILWGSADREWADIQSAVVRYDYDPRRATQLLDGLQNWRSSSDGCSSTGIISPFIYAYGAEETRVTGFLVDRPK